MQSEEELVRLSSTFNEALGGAVCYWRTRVSLVILKSTNQQDGVGGATTK